MHLLGKTKGKVLCCYLERQCLSRDPGLLSVKVLPPPRSLPILEEMRLPSPLPLPPNLLLAKSPLAESSLCSSRPSNNFITNALCYSFRV